MDTEHAITSWPPRRSGAPAVVPRVLLDGASWTVVRAFSDVLALIAGCVVGQLIVSSPDGVWIVAVFPPLTILLLSARGRYQHSLRESVLDGLTPGFGAVSISAMSMVTLQLLVAGEGGSVGLLMAWTWIVSLGGVTLIGVALTLLRRTLHRRRLVDVPTLIVGADRMGTDVAARLLRHPEFGLRPVGFLDAPEAAAPAGDAPPILGDLDRFAQVCVEHGIRHVIIGFPGAPDAAVLELVSRCDALGLKTSVVPRLTDAVNREARLEYLGIVPLVTLSALNLEGGGFVIKHLLDRLVASIALVGLAPLLALVAVAVRLSSPGPILFRQPRTGRDGRVFGLLKFRTMTVGREAPAQYVLQQGCAPGGVEGVDRRTRVGRLLRRTSLDELPQLLNVMRGEMSIVGPRPERPEYADLFLTEVDRYRDRHRVRAGITGLAQVHGMRGQTPVIDRVELDNFYIEHWSLTFDLKILVRTIPALLRGS